MIEIIMPQFGETSEEDITILKWDTNPGDRVDVGDVLLEVETEKSTLEIEAIDSGVLHEIVRHAGEVVKPGEVVGYIKK